MGAKDNEVVFMTQMLKNLQRTPKPYESLTLFAKDQLVGTVEVVVNEVLHDCTDRENINEPLPKRRRLKLKTC